MQSRHWDIAGICVTSACAIHCFLMPVLLPVLPLLSLHWLATPAFEAAALTVSIGIAAFALMNGYRHHHGRLFPALCALTGFVLYACKGSLGEHYEAWILAAGATLIVVGHSMNLRLRFKTTAQ